MPFRFFTVPVQSSIEAVAELNALLSSHKALAVDRRWVDHGTNSFWAVFVDYLATGGTTTSSKVMSWRSRLDYKEILSPPEFEVFSRLRGLRKEIAAREAIPVCAVFANEQLARFVQLRCRMRADLSRVEGVEEARLEKSADRILEFLSNLPERNDAAGGPPV